MAAIMTKRGNQDNVVTYEFICDSTADLQAIEPKYITLGSIATVISGETGFEVYMANSQKQWISLGGGSGNSGGSEQETWVNKDIIVSVPESASYEAYSNEPVDIQSNIQLNNHIITGTIRNAQESENEMYGSLALKIDPSLISSFVDAHQLQTVDITKEYYIVCYTAPASTIPSYSDLGSEMVIFPDFTFVLDKANYNLVTQVGTVIDTLLIYKIPGYIAEHLYNTGILLSYALSNRQPEATYDVSQLTYETPQAGE